MKNITTDYISMNLADKNGYLTNTGILLSDQNTVYQSRVFCTHWNGKTKTSLDSEAIDDKEINGSIVQQLFSSLEFIKNNMKIKWHKSGIYRIDKPDYDLEAVREALVNALIHRDYTRVGSEVSIDIYLDRLEITSPGGMLSGELIKIKNHSVIPSERRNPYIADIFARMKFMERRGSGLNKIIDKTNDLFGNKDVHVEYISLTNYFKVIIFNSNYKVDAVNDADDVVNDALDAVKDADDAVNDAVDVVKDADDAVKDVDDAVKDVDDAVNDVDDAVNDALDAVNDAVDAVKDADDAVNDEVINIIKKYPGLRVPLIYNLIKQNNPNITINMIRNRIRRELKNQVIFKGNYRTGGYYIKNNKNKR